MIRPTAPSPLAAPAAPPDTSPRARLREQADQLEAVFSEQLFKAMRETVPQGEGAFDGGSGEEMFTGLLDQRLAAETPKTWHHGIGEALYRQLSRALPPETTPATAAPTPAAPAATTEDPR